MDDEEDQQQPAMAPAQRTTGWDGMTATNHQTGERLVYRINPSGHGRWVALNSAAAPQADRQRLTELTTRSQIGQRTLGLAREFEDLNATAATGGMQNDPGLPEWMRPQNAQRFQALSNQMVGANWQPGTSGMMNTATEQNMMRGRYPSPTNRGPVNRDVFLQMSEDVGVQQAAVNDMRQWLTQHTTLDGWDEHWGQIESRLRPQIRRQAEQQFNARVRQLQTPQSQSQGAGADIRIDRNGNLIR